MADTPGVQLNRTAPWATNSYWLICLEYDHWKSEQDRDNFMLRLKASEVDSRPYFYPMTQMPYLVNNAHTPVTEQVYVKGINLPTFFDLTEAQVQFICKAILDNLDA